MSKQEPKRGNSTSRTRDRSLCSCIADCLRAVDFYRIMPRDLSEPTMSGASSKLSWGINNNSFIYINDYTRVDVDYLTCKVFIFW